MSNLTLCSYITSNIAESNFQKWVDTAKKWGYNYKIIGRDEVWYTKNDWGRRTRSYVNFLEKNGSDNDLFLFTDSTDVLLAGYPEDLVKSFIEFTKRYNARIVVGGELFAAYRMENHSYYEHKVAQKSHGRYTYPNGGMVMGYKKDLLKMYKSIEKERCDQMGIMKLIANGDTTIVVDCQAELFVNIPYYFLFTHNEANTWNYVNGKLTSTHGTNPYVVHFPWQRTSYLIDKYYTAIMNDQNMNPYHPLELPLLFISLSGLLNGLLIIVIVFLILIYLLYRYEMSVTNFTMRKISKSKDLRTR